MFGEKSVVGPEKSFSSSELISYIQYLIRELSKKDIVETEGPNYKWLSSRIRKPILVEDLENLNRLAQKVTPEKCAAIAVKLDTIVEESEGKIKAQTIVEYYKKLLEEQYTCQLIAANVEERKKIGERKSRTNRVSPELFPPGRQATVSFIFQTEGIDFSK